MPRRMSHHPLSISEAAMARQGAGGGPFSEARCPNRDERNIFGWYQNVEASDRASTRPITTVVALSIALTAARPTARSFPERWPAVPPWGTYCGPRPPTRSGSPGGPSVCEGGGDAEMRALVAFHGTGVQEKPSRVEVNRPFRDLHHIGGLATVYTPPIEAKRLETRWRS